MNTWLKAKGTLRWRNNTLRIEFNNDFVNFYKWFIERYYCFFIHAPMHGGHISVWLHTKHGQMSKLAFESIKEYLDHDVDFEYNINIRVGGFTKRHRNFLIDVRSKKLKKITNILGIDQNFHITVANTKGGIRPYIFK